MHTRRSLVLFVFGAWILVGCAARRYQPAPIVPIDSALRLESRNLGDSGLRAFLEKGVGHPIAVWPSKTWDLGTLSLAALYFNPTLEGARVTAGLKIWLVGHQSSENENNRML